jgi:hypothetical protein
VPSLAICQPHAVPAFIAQYGLIAFHSKLVWLKVLDNFSSTGFPASSKDFFCVCIKKE